MIKVLHTKDAPACGQMLRKIKSRSIVSDGELLNAVSAIVTDVSERGDAALIDYTRRFDKLELSREALRVDGETLRQSAAKVEARVLEAMREAIANVRRFHERQVEASWEYSPAPGIRLGQIISALESAGVYVPGGTAAYPSSVIMNVVPAQIAGVKRIVVTTPPRTITDNPAMAAALVELG